MPFFEYYLTFPVVSASFFAADNMLNSDKNNIPMGTGKYKMQSVDINTQMELKTNPTWWKAENTNLRIATITVRFYKTLAEVYNSYKLGGIDFITSQSLNIEDTIGTIGSNIEQEFGRNFDYLALNTKSSFLSQKEVRQALSYAINKNEIIQTVYDGKYIEADYPLQYGSYLYLENHQNQSYQQEKAKEILQNNGWNFQNGIWQKKQDYHTLRLRLSLVVQATNEARVKVAEIIQKNLEEIGIQVTLTKASDRNVSKLSYQSKL